MISTSSRLHQARVFLLLFTFMTSSYMFGYRAVIQAGDTQRALDAVTSLSRHGDWLMDESNWFKPPVIIRHATKLPLGEYEVEERLNIHLASLLMKVAEALPSLGNIHTVLLFNVIVTSLSVGLIYLFARALEYNDAVALLVSISAGVSTNLWAYSQTFFREPLAALLILSALLALQIGRNKQIGLRLLSLVCATSGIALAFATKYSAAFAIPALLAFALPDIPVMRPRLRRRLASALILLPLLLLAGLMFVDPLPASIQNLLTSLGFGSEFIGIALRTYVLSPGAGIWGTSPLLLLALFGGIFLWRRGHVRLVCAIILLLVCYCIGHALFIGRHWFGGLSWPPRFLVPVIPLLTLALAPIAEMVIAGRQRMWRLLWAVLLIYGIWIQFNGVALSWNHYGDTLPAESGGLAEWAPSLTQPQFFRWFVLPQRWRDLGLDFIWTRSDLPIWGISFGAFTLLMAVLLWRYLLNPTGRWRYASPILATLIVPLTLLNLTAVYNRDPRTQSQQPALQEMLEFLEAEASADDVLLLPGNHYSDFILNHQDSAAPRPIVLTQPLAQAASDRQPAQVVSANPNDWLSVQSVRAIQHLAGHRDRLWLLANTSPFMSWSFRPVERYLAQHYYPLREVMLNEADDTARLLEYSTRSPAPNPFGAYAGDTPTDLRYGDQIRLLAIALPNGKGYQPGDAIELSLLWQSDAALEDDYTVAWFIAPANVNQPIAQGQDSRPQAGFAPTSAWVPGVPVWDNRALRLPAEAAPGDYHIWVLLYRFESATGEVKRLPVSGANVTSDGDIGILPVTLAIK